ncbi:MAG: ATP-binding protein [Acidobacteriota bacterium]
MAKYMSKKEVERILNVSRSKIEQWCKDGKLTTQLLPGGETIFNRGEVQALKKALRKETQIRKLSQHSTLIQAKRRNSEERSTFPEWLPELTAYREGVSLLEALETENRRVKAFSALLINNSVDGILAFDKNLRLIIWNPVIERISGLGQREVVGKYAFEIAPFLKEIGDGRYFFDALNGISSVATDKYYQNHQTGTEGFFECYYSPIYSESGAIVGGLAIIRDISERKRAEADRLLLIQERAARAEAEAVGRAKDEFLATLSHELRTPLTAILGWAQLLNTGKLDQDATIKALQTIERNARIQTRLIDDLLDVSRIINGKLELRIAAVDILYITEMAIDSVKLTAETKSIQLEANLMQDVGQVLGDAARLQQVIWNLLSNAVKYTPNGGRIEARLARVGKEAEIVIQDNGIGIAPELLVHIFEKFVQASHCVERRATGLGLGLTIVRHLVEMHGGSVTAYSAGQGLGATFTVRLPLLCENESPSQ